MDAVNWNGVGGLATLDWRLSIETDRKNFFFKSSASQSDVVLELMHRKPRCLYPGSTVFHKFSFHFSRFRSFLAELRP